MTLHDTGFHQKQMIGRMRQGDHSYWNILEYTGIYWKEKYTGKYKTALFWGYTGKYTGISKIPHLYNFHTVFSFLDSV